MPIRTLEPGRFFAASERGGRVREAENVPENDDHNSSDAIERRLFELASDALVITALDGTIRRANPAALELVGRDESGVTGSSMWELGCSAPAEDTGADVIYVTRGITDTPP